ncbi:OmpP1/FadL family transporter [Leptobacterium sp. I13]|uniref:OmpP1/FadL family transporter n=1 Tax=Leptobacterium meishanense TaxID=3128904 RepID=UPI0030EEEC6C
MKKIAFFFAVVLTATVNHAQSISDVLRYSMENTQGTARFQGLSGAMGAIGGDLSAINVNPAGSSLFKNSFLTFSLSNYNANNETRYFNGFNESDTDNVEFNQAGGVLVFKNANPESKGWKKFAIAFNYDLVNSYDNEFFASGISDQSIDQYFLTFAQGVPLGPLFIQDGEFIEEAYLDIGANLGFGPQQAFLGYFGGVIDPVDINDDNNTDYISNGIFSDVNQAYLRLTSGYNNKFTANVSGQYNEHLFVGASLNFHDVFYENFSLFEESGYDATSPLQGVSFDNLLRTFGDAFSFTIGGIAKINDAVHIGATYQSPTWYRFTDQLSQRINSNLADSEIGFIDFSIVNIFPDYKIQVPAKLTGSLALIFGEEGFINFDYSYQNMENAELRPNSDPDFANENAFISSQLKAVSSFKIGGEYKIDDWHVRGGYRFEESPYENSNTIGDLSGFSLGVGYTFGPTVFDVGFSQTQRDINTPLFETGLTNAANIDATNTNLTFSLSFNL